MYRHYLIGLVAAGLLAGNALQAAPNYFQGFKNGIQFDPTRPVINGATFQDIRQTNATTCSLLASLSAAVASGFDAERQIKHLGGCEYSVRLFHLGRWADIKVTFDGWTDHDPAAQDVGEFWVALYHRAYLQAWNVDCSDTDPNQWGILKRGKKTTKSEDQLWQEPSRALRAVTGKEVQERCLNQADPGDTIKAIAAALLQKRCVVITIWDGAEKKMLAPEVCLVTNHAYTVVAAGPDWIEVRNPWGIDIDAKYLSPSWQLDKLTYRFMEGFCDGKDNNPNDGVVRVSHERIKLFTHTSVSGPLRNRQPSNRGKILKTVVRGSRITAVPCRRLDAPSQRK